jgi:hypothetical protein
VVWLERDVQVDCSASRRVALALPFLGSGSPCMLHSHVIPARHNSDRRGKAKWDSGKDREHGKPIHGRENPQDR